MQPNSSRRGATLIDRMQAFLKELASLAGQGTGPVLELQCGDMRTVTMLSQQSDPPALCISVQLPHDESLDYSQVSLSCGEVVPEGTPDTTCLWHADEGCYAMVRNIPLRKLPDERSVFDAILDTADKAEQWYAFLRARLSAPH